MITYFEKCERDSKYQNIKRQVILNFEISFIYMNHRIFWQLNFSAKLQNDVSSFQQNKRCKWKKWKAKKILISWWKREIWEKNDKCDQRKIDWRWWLKMRRNSEKRNFTKKLTHKFDELNNMNIEKKCTKQNRCI